MDNAVATPAPNTFNEAQWLQVLFLLADTQSWLQQLQEGLIWQLPVKNVKAAAPGLVPERQSAGAYFRASLLQSAAPPTHRQVYHFRTANCSLHKRCRPRTARPFRGWGESPPATRMGCGHARGL